MRTRPGKSISSPAPPSAPGAGDYLRPADEEKPAGGGRAKGKKKPLSLRYPCFARVIELHGMARDDKPIPHRSLSLSSHHTVLVSSIISFLRLVIRLVLVIYRLVPRLVPSSCYCVSYPHTVVSIRAVIVPVIYHRPAHLFIHHPIVTVPHYPPHIAPSPHCVPPCGLIHIIITIALA